MEHENQSNINSILSDATDKVIKEFAGQRKDTIRVADNILAFIGSSGGTGTSTTVANLAYKVSKMGLTVLIIDLNILYPIQHTFFGVKQELERKDLVSFLLGKNEIGASIVNCGDISLLFANNRYLVDSINCDTSSCSENLENALKHIRHLFDLILIDCPLAIENDVVNTMLFMCDRIYTVWDESLSCIANIERMHKNMQLSGIDTRLKLSVIMNKKTNIYYPKSIFSDLGVDFVGTLPFDTSVIESGLKGEIYCEKGASLSKNAAAYVASMQSLAEKVLETGGYKA